MVTMATRSVIEIHIKIYFQVYIQFFQEHESWAHNKNKHIKESKKYELVQLIMLRHT